MLFALFSAFGSLRNAAHVNGGSNIHSDRLYGLRVSRHYVTIVRGAGETLVHRFIAFDPHTRMCLVPCMTAEVMLSTHINEEFIM